MVRRKKGDQNPTRKEVFPWERRMDRGNDLSKSLPPEQLKNSKAFPIESTISNLCPNSSVSTSNEYLSIDILSEIVKSRQIAELGSAAHRRLYRKILTRNHKTMFSGLDNKFKTCQADESYIGFFKRECIKPWTSTYTLRKLKPFIWQDTQTIPNRAKIFLELKPKVMKRFKDLDIPDYKVSPLIFSYVRPEHIAAMTELAELCFWPDVNIEIALAYPEFTCVASYKKLVVGFGLLTPGEHISEGYLNFLCVRPQWERCGIGSFILYHLSQTCLSWDLSLNVSATNPSMVLYQDFGYKIHTMQRGFYTGYLISSRKEDKHSYLMVSEREK